uniref:Uncharacterized protein n=1 Tax=Zea mays TaxID=4577 RepID=B6U4Z8_MAIZE|nr:hypothetical protein [Zea mays]
MVVAASSSGEQASPVAQTHKSAPDAEGLVSATMSATAEALASSPKPKPP